MRRNCPSFGLLALILLTIALAWSGCSTDRDTTAPPDTGAGALPEKGMPAGYYDAVDASSQAALRRTLHATIDDHQRVPYTSGATDTWDVLERADSHPGDPDSILDLYRNATYPKAGGDNSNYDREHAWPKSYGFPNDVVANYPYTDCHHLFLCDSGYNSSRSNKPYRFGDATCLEKPTTFNDGQGGGTGVYPGNSNWTSGQLTEGRWETWSGRRGDVARALFYLDVRYEGDRHGITNAQEPDLILTDEEALIAACNTGSNEAIGYMGMLSVLLQWHLQDPVDDKERARNDAVHAHQGNRNPFIDHPEWVECVFLGNCGGGDTTPPAPPAGLAALGGDGVIDLDWSDSAEPDLAGYNVYRATVAGGPYGKVNGSLLGGSSYSDATVTDGTTYHYVVTAVDGSQNESGYSAEASATPQGGAAPATPWINEFHYDNDGADTGEFVEVAGPAGTSLAGWRLIGYNGYNGLVYATVNLSGALPDQQAGHGTLGFAFVGLQNGSPDGIALVDGGGTVVHLLSYEGSFVAADGPAAGMTLPDIGVSQPTNCPVGHTLQLGGTGTVLADFAWQVPLAGTAGAVNANQTFGGGGGGDTTPPAAPTGLAAVAGDAVVSLDWADNGEGDLAGYNVYRADGSGGPYAKLNGALLASSGFSDGAVTNGTTYWYVVTAADAVGNESGYSAEVSATPTAPPPPTGTVVHVSEIVLSQQLLNAKTAKGVATVTIVDAAGAPVAGATVTGTFSGSVNETRSATTGSDGKAVLVTSVKNKPPLSFTFCVDAVMGTDMTYDAGANVVTCGSF